MLLHTFYFLTTHIILRIFVHLMWKQISCYIVTCKLFANMFYWIKALDMRDWQVSFNSNIVLYIINKNEYIIIFLFSSVIIIRCSPLYLCISQLLLQSGSQRKFIYHSYSSELAWSLFHNNCPLRVREYYMNRIVNPPPPPQGSVGAEEFDTKIQWVA